ncbi:MAG: UPF0104 family protein [Opitutaceae bacterium]|nr:UPF0104 family protein [Opitutaceae bacterium]
MRRLTSFFATPAGRATRYLISLTLLWLLARRIDFGQLTALHGQFSLPLTITAVLIAGITYPLHAWRWQQLLRAQGVPLSLHWAHVVTWIGQFYNAFLLGGIGGDAARVFYLVRDASAQRAAGFTTLIIDRAMGLVVLMALAAAALAARSATFALEPRLSWLFFAAIAINIGGALTAVVLLRVTPMRWPQSLRRLLGPTRLATTCQLLECIRATPLAHLTALALGGVIWVLDFISAWLLAQAIGLPLPFLETCVAMSVAYAATALPISVGGHGVREGALLTTLAAFGLLATPELHDRAVLLALMVWATTIFWSLFGGLFVLAAPKLLPPTEPRS